MEITREKLQKMYNEKYNREVCEILGITQVTLISMLRRHNIPLKGMGNRTHSTKIKVI